MTENNTQIIIYQTENGETKLEVRLENETVWLSQKLMAALFQTTVANINIHLKNIFEEGELDMKATIKDFLIVRIEGSREVNRTIEYYNLDAIISVGYRIKSNVATRFRQWATQHIKEYIVKGFGEPFRSSQRFIQRISNYWSNSLRISWCRKILA